MGGDTVIRAALPLDDGERPTGVSESEWTGDRSADEAARFLAGLPGKGSGAMGGARRSAAWKEHERQMDAAFTAANGRLNAIRSWRRGVLGSAGSGTLFYPFSGPDFLFADAFFPRSRTVIMCGLEPVGQPPETARISGATLASSLANLRSSISTPLNFSYFITKDMRNDLAPGRSLSGVTPIIYTFLARTNHRVLSADAVALNGSGQVVSRSGAAGGTAPGIRIKAAGRSGVRTIYYFRTNLGDGTLGRDRRFLTFVRSQSPSATFVKSASYLMHSGGFNQIRTAVKTLSPVIVQDPTGVPYKQLAAGAWDITLYGNYRGTLDMFRSHYQPDLAAAYKSGGGKAMPFGVGYKWNLGESSLVVARRR